MTESMIAGTELTITARIAEDGTLTVAWDRLPTSFLFHDGYAAILCRGSGETAGMVELRRVRVDAVMSDVGHVEPLLS
jgi:hypothetical protein